MVYSQGSNSSPSKQHSASRAQTHSPAEQIPEAFLCVSQNPLGVSDNTRGKNNKQANNSGSLGQGSSSFFFFFPGGTFPWVSVTSSSEGASGPLSLWSPSLLLSECCPASIPWWLLAPGPQSSPPELNTDHPFWSKFKSSREGLSWDLPG